MPSGSRRDCKTERRSRYARAGIRSIGAPSSGRHRALETRPARDRPIDTADQVQQRALARPRWSHHDRNLPGTDPQPELGATPAPRRHPFDTPCRTPGVPESRDRGRRERKTGLEVKMRGRWSRPIEAFVRESRSSKQGTHEDSRVRPLYSNQPLFARRGRQQTPRKPPGPPPKSSRRSRSGRSATFSSQSAPC